MQPDKLIQPGTIKPLSLTLNYQADPLSVLNTLCRNSNQHLLLESAEVDSKTNLKSLLLVDASLRLICNGSNVSIQALTANGAVLLPYLISQLGPTFKVTSESAQCISIDCPSGSEALSEDERLKAPGNLTPLRILQRLKSTSEHPFSVFLGGLFGYDLIASFEHLPEVAEGDNTCPDYIFYLAENLLIMDHQAKKTELIGYLTGGDDLTKRQDVLCQRMGELSAQLQHPSPVRTSPVSEAPTVAVTPDAATFADNVTALKESIYAGDIFQVVPSRQFSLPCNNALAAYQQLKKDNPSPYMFYLKADTFELFGASPESALKYCKNSNQVELYPIAGTRLRGKNPNGSINPDLDSRIELELRNDQKEMAEHMMLVDLARNDLARIAITGTRHIANLLKVDRYSHVMHLVSRVVAQLRPELDALDAYRACMNMGTLTGAPKISASRLIRLTEKKRRGSYGGAVGYLNGQGDMDTCIVIRSAFVSKGTALIRAGAGIVFDSVPAAEVAETENKARAVINAIIQAQPVVEANHE